MKCPLRLIGWKGDLGLADFPQVDCLGEECAWWDKKHGICGELTKTKSLVEISNYLDDIASKTPLQWS